MRAPGSTANLGPGFDVLGLAIDRYCVAYDHQPDQPFSESNCTDGPCAPDHIARIAYERAGGEGDIWFDFNLPPGRGLGFSAAARAAGAVLAGVNQGLQIEAAREAGYLVVAELEGHGDNAAPSVFGGLQIVTGEHRFRVSAGMHGDLVFWTPETSTSTDESRASLPTMVPRADAVFNIGRVALLIAALYEGDVQKLRTATQDRIHQDHRLKASPSSALALDAALAAGATTAWLSGSGPTIAALCPLGEAERIAAALPNDGVTMTVHVNEDGSALE